VAALCVGYLFVFALAYSANDRPVPRSMRVLARALLGGAGLSTALGVLACAPLLR
jgi:hypothetical protein